MSIDKKKIISKIKPDANGPVYDIVPNKVSDLNSNFIATLPTLTKDEKLLVKSELAEANLAWGGKNFAGAYGPIDAAMIGELGANRTAFAKAAGIIIEYSRDGGTTWVPYITSSNPDADDQNHIALFSIGRSFTCGNARAEANAGDLLYWPDGNCQLRVSLNTKAAGIYTQLNKFAFYVSTSGSSTCTVSIEAKVENKEDIDANYELISGPNRVTGWSGWNIINTKPITTYGNSPTYQYGTIRFVFKYEKYDSSVWTTDDVANGKCPESYVGHPRYNGLSVSKIMCFGGVGWTTPSNMAATGKLYSYDVNQTMILPHGARPAYNNVGFLGTNDRRWSEVHAYTYYEGGHKLRDLYVYLSTNQTIAGQKTFTKPIFAYGYSTGKDKAVIIGDKPGSNYWGIGADGTSNRIKFGPVTGAAGDWISASAFESNNWYFQGDLTASRNIYEKGKLLSDTYLGINDNAVGVKDINNKQAITFQFSTGAELTNPQYIAAWDGYKVAYTDRAKLQVAGAENANKLDGKDSTYFAALDEIKFSNSTPCTETIGGIQAGTTFDKVPVLTMLNKILYKYYAPKITGVSISASINNNYLGGTTTAKNFTVSFDRGTTGATFTSLTATFNGKSYTATDPKFTGKTYSYTFDIVPDDIFKGTSSVTHIVKPAVINCVLANAGENGESKTLTYTRNLDVYFNRSDYYYGGSSVNDSKQSLSTITNQYRWEGDFKRHVFQCNQNYPTLICPASWGNTISVQDGAKNPVNGVFSKVNTIKLTNKNNYIEDYNVFQSNTKASGGVAYLIKIS